MITFLASYEWCHSHAGHFLLSLSLLSNFLLCAVAYWYCWICGAGYLSSFCRTLLEELDRLPGDSRMQIGFIAFDSLLYFYGLDPSFPQPKMFIISDLDGIVLCFRYDPSPSLWIFMRNVSMACHGTMLVFVIYAHLDYVPVVLNDMLKRTQKKATTKCQ